MSLKTFIRSMPKVELHVHLEGAIQPSTLLTLAKRHGIALPANTVAGLRQWYTFRDFAHFVEVYFTISRCIQSPDDIELITQEFLSYQASQNIRYSEVTYSAFTHYVDRGIPIAEQFAAIRRVKQWAETTLGVSLGLVVDIVRDTTAEQGLDLVRQVIPEYGDGLILAIGLGGSEVGNPPSKHALGLQRARAAGIPLVLHAGETAGPPSIWEALQYGSLRIGHGVRCLEDPALVAELRQRQIPLEVCPSSNVCLGVVPSFAHHPIQQLIDAGLYVTLNSDDPPMFNTTLTDEYLLAARVFGWDRATVERLGLNAVRASLLPPTQRYSMEQQFVAEFQRL